MYTHILTALKRFGDTSVFLSFLQPGLSYFLHNSGCIAYTTTRTWGKTVVLVLGDPLCDISDLKGIIIAFLKEHSSPTFINIRDTTADVLSTLGFYNHCIGTDTVLSLHTAFSWKSHKSLIRHSNKARREGVFIKEGAPTHFSPEVLLNIRRSWLASKISKKLKPGFLLRPLVLEEEPGARYFFAYDKTKKLIGYRFYYPLYRNELCIGYYADINHISSSAPIGTSYLLMLKAILQFKKEGYSVLSLGLSPFYIPKSAPTTLLSFVFKCTFYFGNFFYSFKGLHEFKKRLHGSIHMRYISSKSTTPLRSLFSSYKLTTHNNHVP